MIHHFFLKGVNKKKSEIGPNKDLKQISEWAYQWKTLFNPDRTKQATEVGFSHKRDNVPYEPLIITKHNLNLLKNIWNLS